MLFFVVLQSDCEVSVSTVDTGTLGVAICAGCNECTSDGSRGGISDATVPSGFVACTAASVRCVLANATVAPLPGC